MLLSINQKKQRPIYDHASREIDLKEMEKIIEMTKAPENEQNLNTTHSNEMHTENSISKESDFDEHELNDMMSQINAILIPKLSNSDHEYISS